MEFQDWLASLDDVEIIEILYEFYLCLLEEDCEEVCGECSECLKKEAARKFHVESILLGEDHEVAALSWKVLEKHFPGIITEELKTRAKELGIFKIKPSRKLKKWVKKGKKSERHRKMLSEN